MSDFGTDPQLPTPPQAGAVPPPPQPYGAPPPGYGGYPQVAQKPPRPAVPIAGYLCIAGGALLILGSALNWFTVAGEKYNGFSSSGGDSKDGPAFVFFALLAIGAGITFLAAKRVLAVAITILVFEVLAVFIALADLGDLGDAKDLATLYGLDFSSGPGLYVVLLGAIVAVAGNIVALAKRRR